VSRFKRAEELFHAVSELPREDRGAFLDDACGSDAELRGEIQELLALLDEEAPADLQTPLPDRTSAADEGGDVPEDLQAFGPYTLLNEVARGGQGVVYLAEDTRLRRRVALKVLSAGAAQFQAMRVRLLREAEAASRLEHPNICSVYEVGEVDGLPFIAMRFVEGKTLARIIQEARSAATSTEPPSSTSRNELLGTVAIIEQAARALHAAHEVGLVHRDVKPGNIMITPAGDPVLVDFGLVHDEESAAHVLTQTGQLLGTPAYMAPEQIATGRIEVDRRTDVYALGVTLFEALTLRRPFEAPTRDRLYQQILATDAPDPRGLNRRIPKDLKVVLEVSLEKDPNRRYQTALDLAEDLKRVRSFEPIRARPTPLMRRLKRWVQRNRVAAAIMAVVIAALVMALWSFGRVSEEKTTTERVLRHSRMLNLAAASDDALDHDAPLALLLAREAVKLEPTVESISQLHRVLAEPLPVAILRKKYTTRSDVTVYSPDSRRLISISRNIMKTGYVTIWDVSGQKIGSFRTKDRIVGERISHAGDRLALRVRGKKGDRVEYWNDRGERLATVGTDQRRVRRFLVRPPGKECLILFTDGSAERFDWNGRRIGEQAFSVPGVEQVRFSAGGDALVVACADGKLHLLSGDGQLVRTCGRPVPAPRQLLFREGAHRVFARLKNGEVLVWNIDRDDDVTVRGEECTGLRVSDRGDRFLTLHGEGNPRVRDLEGDFHPLDCKQPSTVSILPGGRSVTLNARGQLCFWDKEARLSGAHQSPGERYEHLCWSRPAKSVLHTSDHARLFDFNGKLLGTFWIDSLISDSGFAPDGTTFFTEVLQSKTLRIWKTAPEPNLPRVDPGVGTISVTASRDGKWIATGHIDGTARIWDRSGALRHVLGEPFLIGEFVPFPLAFSPDGRHLLTGSFYTDPTRRARLWSVERGGLVQTFSHHSAATGANRDIVQVAFSPDGSEVLTASIDGTARAWTLGGVSRVTFGTETTARVDLSDPATMRRFVTCVDVSPDGQWVLTGHGDGTARLWARDGALRRTIPSPMPGSHTALCTARFSPKGERIAVVVVDTGSLKCVLNVQGVDGGRLLSPQTLVGLWRVVFSPDGALMAGVSLDGSSAQILNAETGEPLAFLRPRGVRLGEDSCFTPDGKRLLTPCREGRPLKAWIVRTEDLLREAEKKTVRALTPAERQNLAPLLENPENR